MLITQILATFVDLNYKSTTMELPFAESWKIKMVEPIRKSTREEREQWIKEAHYNVFQLKSEQVYIDLITDSGTGAMSDRQWAGMMLGDESYAGATSFFKLKEMITKLTGFEYIIPTHQGRAAENVLFSYLVHEGDIVPGNSHFDTTKGHIEGRHAIALDCTIDAAKQTQLEIPFKGNVDPDKLQKALTEYAERIPFIIVTITNNTAGGQPVSMQTCTKYVPSPTNMANPYFSTLHVLPRMPTSSKCAKKVTETKLSKKSHGKCSLLPMA